MVKKAQEDADVKRATMVMDKMNLQTQTKGDEVSRPVIGLVTKPLAKSLMNKKGFENKHSYVMASYVDYLHA